MENTTTNTNNKRKVAVKARISDLISGTYIKRPGWEPSGVLTKYGELTRINMTGLVVSVDESESLLNFMLDDGSSSITARMFEKPYYVPKIGDIVRVIARVREDNNQIFIVPEIVKKIDKVWHELHKIETNMQKKDSPKLPIETDNGEVMDDVGPYQKVLNALSILDKGEGVDIIDITNHLKIKDGEKIIAGLIEEGEIFEISPGRVKLLE